MRSDFILSHKVEGFVIGVTASIACYFMISAVVKSCSKGNNSAYADDKCQSLFYDKVPGENGIGFPELNTTSEEVLASLRTTHLEYARLPMEMYKSAVECLPIVCVDTICKRRKDGKLLLFYRRDKPAAGIWWWPGGRMFKGETFFECAIRKIRDETGNKDARVTPVGIVDVWNTFFPDSSWDRDRAPGREGTQTVNITVVCLLEDDEFDLVQTAQEQWAVEARRWVTPSAAVQEGAFDKYVSLNVRKAQTMGLI